MAAGTLWTVALPHDLADEARYEELLAKQAIAPGGSVPDDIQRYLMRDTGPTAIANGGDPVTMILALTALARGSNPVAAATPALRIVAA